MSSTALIINEKQTIRCLIDDPGKITQLEKNYFMSPVGRALFDGLLELYMRSVPITKDHLLAEGSRRSSEVTAAIVDSLLEDQAFSPEVFATQYLPRLRSDYAKKSFRDDVLRETLIEAESRDPLDVENVRRLMRRMQETIDLYEGKTSRLLSLKQAGVIYQHELRGRTASNSYRVSDAHLNRALQAGLLPKQMTVLFGATGLGKSTVALHMASKDINKRRPAAYVSLEMDLISTMDRLVGMRLGIPFMNLLPNPDTGIVDPFVLEAVGAEISRIEKNEQFFFLEEDSLGIADLESTAKEALRRADSETLIMYVDLMTMVSEFSGGEANEYEYGMNKWHEAVRRTKIHAVDVVQANRRADDARISSVDQIERLRPARNTIKNSQAILERCRNQISVFRPKYYAKQMFRDDPATEEMADVISLQVLKQSMGPVGHIVDYLFRGETFQMIPIRSEAPQERTT